MKNEIFDKSEIPSEGTLVLIQDTSFSTLKAFGCEEKFFSELKELEEKTEKTRIILLNNIISEGSDYYYSIVSVIEKIPETINVILITSSRFYGPVKQPDDIIKKFLKRKRFVYVERSEGNPFYKISDFSWRISKKTGELEKLFQNMKLIQT